MAQVVVVPFLEIHELIIPRALGWYICSNRSPFMLFAYNKVVISIRYPLDSIGTENKITRSDHKHASTTCSLLFNADWKTLNNEQV